MRESPNSHRGQLDLGARGQGATSRQLRVGGNQQLGGRLELQFAKDRGVEMLGVLAHSLDTWFASPE